MLINYVITNPQAGIILIVSLMFALTLHEFGHAYVAYLFGDPTAQLAGRMNINPLAHLDPIGSVMILFAGIGYAKPVPVNPRNYRHPKADLFVSAAGPGMNLLLVFAGAVVAQILIAVGLWNQTAFWIVSRFMLINMALCIFNLIPLGPLDGSYVFPYLLPRDLRYKYLQWNAQYGTIAIMGLLMLSLLPIAFSPFGWIHDISGTVVLTLL